MSKKLWDSMAKSYDNKFKNMYEQILSEIPEAVDTDDEVIEVGCGSGLVSFEIIPKVKKFVGVDFSKKMIDVAKNKLKSANLNNAEFIVGDATKLEILIKRKFDKVALINLLHIVDDPKIILDSVKPLIKPEGKLIVVSFCHGEKMSLKFKIASFFMKLGSLIGLMGKLNRFKFKDLEDLIKNSGYEISKVKRFKEKFPFLYLIASKNP